MMKLAIICTSNLHDCNKGMLGWEWRKDGQMSMVKGG